MRLFKDIKQLIFLNSFINRPKYFNLLRHLLAGNQEKTKEFICNNYHQYSCRSVLDIGCGTGDFASLFNKEEYLGIDINKEYIAYAKKTYPHNFVFADPLKYNFGPHFFDASILISTLHHLSNTQVKKLFPKIISLTKKIIIIVDLNPDGSLIKKVLIRCDRGKYVRTTKEKIALLSPFGKIFNISNFSTRLASQTGMVLLLNHEKK